MNLIECVQRHKKLLIKDGIVFVLLGLLALAIPTIFTLTIAKVIGVLCLIAGCMLAFHIAKGKELPNNSSSIVSMIVYLSLGLVLTAYPLSGVVTLNLLLICFFVLDGIFKITSAIQLRPVPGWKWIFFSGFLSFMLSLLILLSIPEGSAWLLGILVGFHLLSTGATQLYQAWALSKIKP
jgi:uncharacterized membrane protein HdeD (DUF308 family)